MKQSKIKPSKLHPYKEQIKKAYSLGYGDVYIAKEITKEMQKIDKKHSASRQLVSQYADRYGFVRKVKALFK